MAIEIVPISILETNYVWLIISSSEAIAVDVGEAAPVLDYLQKNQLKLTQIWTTHAHGDHTNGIATLKNAFPDCEIFGASEIQTATKTVDEGSKFNWLNCQVSVWKTAGHTANALSYLLHDGDDTHVFCGDTVFSGGCGRIFPDGSVLELFKSIQRINTLPEHTLLYPAHEYTEQNLEFAEYIEPKNPDIQVAQVTAYYPPTLPVTLAHERRINPFFRTKEKNVQERIRELSKLPCASEESVFIALRTLKNIF